MKPTIDDVRAVLLSGAGPQQKIDALEAMILPDPAAPEASVAPATVEGDEFDVPVETTAKRKAK